MQYYANVYVCMHHATIHTWLTLKIKLFSKNHMNTFYKYTHIYICTFGFVNKLAVSEAVFTV